MTVYNRTPHHTTPHHTTPHHTTPSLLPEIKVVLVGYNYFASLKHIETTLAIKDEEFISRFVIDNENPDYVIADDSSLRVIEYCEKLKHYLSRNKNSIFIFYGSECVDPDLNIFDYAITYNSTLKCADRIVRYSPYIEGWLRHPMNANELTHQEAAKLLEGGLKFCNFIYSHPAEPRDTLFHLLSKYKRVDSLGACLNNTGTKSTRYAANSINLSIDLKRGYKFSIAVENTSYPGYTTEKIITSLQAHTVPIYWGDPEAAQLVNPKAFINCHDYSSFDEVMERVREIDSNNDLWLDMVTQPWQTEEQKQRVIKIANDRREATRNIFLQDIKTAKRSPVSGKGEILRRKYTGYIGIMPPFYVRLFLKLRLAIAKRTPAALRFKLKKLLRLKEQ